MLFDRISCLCKENGITVAKLERELGLGNATIRGWGTSSPTVDKLKLVADYFKVSIDELLTPQESSFQTSD